MVDDAKSSAILTNPSEHELCRACIEVGRVS